MQYELEESDNFFNVVDADVKAYTDGSVLTNPGDGGCAWVIVFNDESYYYDGGGVPSVTNNEMEMLAIVEALDEIIESETYKNDEFNAIEIISDSLYCVNGINVWYKKWLSNGWKTASGKPVKNKEFWKVIFFNATKIRTYKALKFSHIRGHSGNQWNELADKIANDYALKLEE